MKTINTIRILSVSALLILAGCSTTRTDVNRADGVCATNGGVDYILTKYNSTVRVTCNNGAKFTLKKEDTE